MVGGEKPVRGYASFMASQMASEAQTEAGLGSLSFLMLHISETISPTHLQAGNTKMSIPNTDGAPAFTAINPASLLTPCLYLDCFENASLHKQT